ncbi:hypothetical protein WJX79_009733 [Trebouxia sp. C0005]
MSAAPAPPVLSKREIQRISLTNFESRKDDITKQLMKAATDLGFFMIEDTGISQAETDSMFARGAQFFALDDKVKAAVPCDPATFVGWERDAEVSPATGFADHKESIQVAYDQRQWGSHWPVDDNCPGFRDEALTFMGNCESVVHKLLECFAIGLGMPYEDFKKALDNSAQDCNSAMRFMNYYDVTGRTFPTGHMRVMPHTDMSALTLLFQRVGETGLEVCPGREATTEYAMGDEWTPCNPQQGAITVNIGDALMYWSDDKLKSNFHRVRAPNPGEYQKQRCSIAYFCQPCLSAVCQGPLKKYPPITGQQMAESRYMELDWLKGHEAKEAAAKGIAGHKLPISVA